MITIDYIVTGLPRSKTAWIANFLTVGDSFCFHEGFNRGVFHVDSKIVGIADSGACINHKEIRDRFPNAKWVIVKRDVEEVNKSLINVVGFDEEVTEIVTQKFVEGLAEIEVMYNPLIIPFNFSLEHLIKMCDYLGVQCSVDRYYLLRDLNIQVSGSIIEKLKNS